MKDFHTPKQIQKIVREINYFPKTRKELFATLSATTQAEIIFELTKSIRFEILSALPVEKVQDLISHLDPDDATDLLRLLPKRKQTKLLKEVTENMKKDVSTLLQFDPETAAGLMSLDYIQVKKDETIAEVARQFRKHEKRTGRAPVILVLNNGQGVGQVPGHELGFARPREKVTKYIKRIQTIEYNAERDRVLDYFRTHPHTKLVVKGAKKEILGIIYADDVLRYLNEKEFKTLYDFAGVAHEENVLDSIKQKVKSRYIWLIINLGTAFLASFTVSLFDATIAKFVLLAIYMPIVAGMGGNAATQTLAVLVRGIAAKQVSLGRAWRTLRNEVVAGLANGVINGIIVASVVLLVNHDLRLAIVLALAMIVNLMVAGFFGTLIPLIMQKLGKDPASSATIFITTATDVLGFMTFLGLATLILR